MMISLYLNAPTNNVRTLSSCFLLMFLEPSPSCIFIHWLKLESLDRSNKRTEETKISGWNWRKKRKLLWEWSGGTLINFIYIMNLRKRFELSDTGHVFAVPST